MVFRAGSANRVARRDRTQNIAGDLMQQRVYSDELARMLGEVDFEVRVVRDVARRLAESTAPEFSVFDFVRTDEMGLSTCLAALLDPKGAHGQGSTYLRQFLEILDAEEHDGWCDDLNSATVLTEAPANDLRRLDIHVRLSGGRAIAIENKPWAGDQNLQLSDYASFLERTSREGGWKLVYLSDRPPSDRSIKRDRFTELIETGRLKLVSFHVLAGWLARCLRLTKPINVRSFLEQMEQFIRQRMCGEVDMSESETVKEIVLGSQGTLRAAILIGKTLHSVKRHLLEHCLRSPFEKAMHDIGLTPVWDHSLLDMRIYTGFGTRFAREAGGYLRFEFERAGLNGLFWGIRRTQKLENGTPDHPAASALYETMAQAFGRGGSSDYWFWYSTDVASIGTGDSPLSRDWDRAEIPWLRMQELSLAGDFSAWATRVREVLQGGAGGEIVLAKSDDPYVQRHQVDGPSSTSEHNLR